MLSDELQRQLSIKCMMMMMMMMLFCNMTNVRVNQEKKNYRND